MKQEFLRSAVVAACWVVVLTSNAGARAQPHLPVGGFASIGSITPEVACGGSRIRLTPAAGYSFPVPQKDWGVFFAPCAVKGRVTSWTSTSIEVEVPKEAVTGAVYVASGPAIDRGTLLDASKRLGCVQMGAAFEMELLDARPSASGQIDPSRALGVVRSPLKTPPLSGPKKLSLDPLAGFSPSPRGMDPREFQKMCKLPGGLICEPSILASVSGKKLTVLKAPRLSEVRADPSFAVSARELGVTEREALLQWSGAGTSNTFALEDLSSGATVQLGNAHQYKQVVEKELHLRLIASNACGLAARDVTLLPAYALRWDPEVAVVPTQQPQTVKLTLSRPALSPLALDLSMSGLSSPATSVIFAPGTFTADVSYTLQSLFNPGTLTATAPATMLTESGLAVFVATPKQPPPGSLVARGVVEYEDCLSNGPQTTYVCSGTRFRAAREVDVAIPLALGPGGFATEFAVGRTNDLGEFSIPLPDLKPPRYTGTIADSLQIRIPTENLLITSTVGGVVFSGAVQPPFNVGVSRGSQRLDSLRLRIRGASAAYYNAYDNVVAAKRFLTSALGQRNLHRMVISLDGLYCLGGAVHTQQIPDWNTLLCGADTATLFADATVLHEYGHHVQHIMGQWRPWPSYHDGCKSQNPFLAWAPLANNKEMAWFEGFPTLFADRVVRTQSLGTSPSTYFCQSVGGAFCTPACTASAFCQLPHACSAVGQETMSWLPTERHPIGSVEVEHYVSAVVQDALAAGPLSDPQLMQVLWDDLRGQEPTLYSVRDALKARGRDVSALERFMAAYGM